MKEKHYRGSALHGILIQGEYFFPPFFEGLRKFMMLLEEDARHYVQKFQRQEPIHLTHLNHVTSGNVPVLHFVNWNSFYSNYKYRYSSSQCSLILFKS